MCEHPVPSCPQRLRLEFDLEGEHWLFHVKPRAVSLSVGGEENHTFDLEGRPYAAFFAGRHYRRGLDGRVLVKHSHQGGDGPRRIRKFLDEEQRRAYLARVRRRVDQLGAYLADASLGRGMEPPIAPRGSLGDSSGAGARCWLSRLQQWDEAALREHERRFHQVYQTVSILPPDQYMALVIQSSEGCPWNRCTFCALYRDRSFRLKAAAELQEHVAAVIRLLGGGIALRRSVFLGDANAMHAPQGRLGEVLASVDAAMQRVGGPTGAYYGFSDADAILRHPVGELSDLRACGLQRLYLGLESGCDALLELLNKPGRAGAMVRAVARLREAGIHAGIIVLLGLGGQAAAARHERETVQVLRSMGLGRGDMIYYSPLIAHPQLEYARQRVATNQKPMSYAEMRQQQRRISDQVADGRPRPRSSVYDIRDFVY